MTLQELYRFIGGDYDRALNVLRVEKLLDKHIRKFPDSGVAEKLFEASENMNSTGLFEAAHAMKGVCANLGLVELSKAASEIAEEYRPGNARKLSDVEVKDRIASIREKYERTLEGILEYVESN